MKNQEQYRAFEQTKEDREQELKDCEERIESLNKEIGELRIDNGLNEDKAKQAFEVTEALKAEIAEKAKEYEIVKARIKELDEKVSSIDELEKSSMKGKKNTLRFSKVRRIRVRSRRASAKR